MRILVIGSAGASTPSSARWPRRRTALHAAPGNPGIAAIAETHPDVAADPGPDRRLARQLGPDLVVIGPEAPLVAGAADALRAAGIACFGPDAGRGHDRGLQVVRQGGHGRGRHPDRRVVHVPDERGGGRRAGRVRAALRGQGRRRWRPARACWSPPTAPPRGRTRGRAARSSSRSTSTAPRCRCSRCATAPRPSRCCPPRTSSGPATATRARTPAAWAPTPRSRWAPAGLAEQVTATVIQPAVDALRRRGTPYRGLLYAGLALTAAGPKVVEFNARFGDPETQVVLDRLATPLARPAARRRHRRPGRARPRRAGARRGGDGGRSPPRATRTRRSGATRSISPNGMW